MPIILLTDACITRVRGALVFWSPVGEQLSLLSSSPDLIPKQPDAVITSLDAHQSMSAQVVNDQTLQKRMLELLLNNFNLYEDLKARAGTSS